jgi:hypothetical protein
MSLNTENNKDERSGGLGFVCEGDLVSIWVLVSLTIHLDVLQHIGHLLAVVVKVSLCFKSVSQNSESVVNESSNLLFFHHHHESSLQRCSVTYLPKFTVRFQSLVLHIVPHIDQHHSFLALSHFTLVEDE